MKKIYVLFLFLGMGILMYYSCKKDETIDLSKLVRIIVTPGDTVIEVGTTCQFTATGVFMDSSTKDISSTVTWTSSPAGKITFSGNGLATAVETGTTFVIAGGGFGIASGSIVTLASSGDVEKITVLQKYETLYLGTELASCGWTGDKDNCIAGTVSQEAHNLVAKRINYFRTFVGLPGDVVLDAGKNAKCQKAALIFKAQGQLNHFPPTDWPCWTQDGYDAAGNSNIGWGTHSVNSVTAYMEDDGGNNTRVGYRRWLLYSRAKVMGHGSTDNSNAIWVMGNENNPLPAGMPVFVAYPPKGYVPAPLVFGRWSFSIPNALFTDALVTMKDSEGQNITPNIISTAPPDEGYGDNTIVWEPAGIDINGPEDTPYTVTVSNVKVGGIPKTYTYTVTIFQVAKGKEGAYKELKKQHPEWQVK